MLRLCGGAEDREGRVSDNLDGEWEQGSRFITTSDRLSSPNRSALALDPLEGASCNSQSPPNIHTTFWTASEYFEAVKLESGEAQRSPKPERKAELNLLAEGSRGDRHRQKGASGARYCKSETIQPSPSAR